jgi:hypothetical protein
VSFSNPQSTINQSSLCSLQSTIAALPPHRKILISRAAIHVYYMPPTQPAQAPPPNQVALTKAREHAKAGRTAEAIAALERVTPPAPAVLNQLRTSDDFKALRDDQRFQAIVTKLMPCQGLQ